MSSWTVYCKACGKTEAEDLTRFTNHNWFGVEYNSVRYDFCSAPCVGRWLAEEMSEKGDSCA